MPCCKRGLILLEHCRNMLELRVGDVCPSPLQIVHLLSELISDIKMCATEKGHDAFVDV